MMWMFTSLTVQMNPEVSLVCLANERFYEAHSCGLVWCLMCKGWGATGHEKTMCLVLKEPGPNLSSSHLLMTTKKCSRSWWNPAVRLLDGTCEPHRNPSFGCLIFFLCNSNVCFIHTGRPQKGVSVQLSLVHQIHCVKALDQSFVL